MKFHIISLFPEMFESPLRESILGRAQAAGLLEFEFYQLRDFSEDKHKKVDDTPFGGGAGMVLTPQPLFDCIEFVKSKAQSGTRVIFLTPQGEELTHPKVQKLSQEKELILLCGHYEGIDQRVREALVDEEISIGKYVLSGGELPALVLIDAVARFVPEVLGNEESAQEESFSEKLDGKREYPHYTKPRVFRGKEVPEVLVSGNHAEIAKWRQENLKD